MTEQPIGPRCGNNPNVQLTPGDRKAVEDFKAYLADRAALRDRIAAYRSPGTRTLYCVICARQETGWQPVTAAEVHDETACDFCGGRVVSVASQTLGQVIARHMTDEAPLTIRPEPACVCGHPIRLHHEDACLLTGCGCADALEISALPEALEAVLTKRFTELGNQFAEMRVHEQGPDGWPSSRLVSPHMVAEALQELLQRSAAGVRQDGAQP